MQAGGRAIRGQEVVQSLVRLLEALGVDSVPRPEAFRRAKFNSGVGLEEQFYLLLANILHRTGVIPSEACSQTQAVSERRMLVAVGLWQTGYRSGWVEKREGGEKRSREEERSREEACSRDLLLALGWLLAAGTLERLLTLRTQQLDLTILPHIPDLMGDLQISLGAQLDPSSLRKLQWLIGYLRFQRRSLMSIQEERARLLHTELCDVLVCYLTWKQQEKVFWAWMDSVVDCHLKEEGPVAVTPRQPSNRRRAVCHHGNRGSERLDDMMLKLPTAQNRESRGEERKGGEEGLERGGGTQSLEASSTSPLLRAYRARLQAERPARPPGQRRCVGAGQPGESQACQASALLLQRDNWLREGRDNNRLANRTQLQEMIGRLEALVLIPP